MQVTEIIGRLTADPAQTEINGKKVTKFSVAVNKKRKAPDGSKVTDFYRVSVWGAVGESCFQYLAKARMVYVRGELNVRTYENADGKTVTSLDLSADQVEFLSQKSEDAAPEKKAKTIPQNDDFTDIQLADIPF